MSRYIGKRRWRKGHKELTLNLPKEVSTCEFDRYADVFWKEIPEYLEIVYRFPRKRGLPGTAHARTQDVMRAGRRIT